MIPILLLNVALALPPTDLDGDGKPETITTTTSTLTVAGQTVSCGDGEDCTVTLQDVVGTDKHKELSACSNGVRDEVYCSLWTYRDGKLTQLPFPKDARPTEIKTSGNGIVLTNSWADRVYYRIEKYVFSGGALKHVPQPAYYANTTLHVDRTFPIVMGPKDGAVVANVRPDSDITIVLESGPHDDWYLVRISSGLTGWVTLDSLVGASDQLMAVMSAG